VADTAMVGSILIPAMKQEGYPKSFSAAVTICSSSLAVIIPPSIAMIVYATVVGGTSIGALFIGGIFAGILMSFLQMLTAYIISIIRKYPRYETPFNLKSFILAFGNAFPAIIAMLIIAFGMRGGAFTATEAAAVLVAYALFLGLVWYRNLTLKKIVECALESIKMAGSILLIIGAAGPFMWVLTRERIIQNIMESLDFITTSPSMTYIFIIIFLVVAGMVMEGTAILIVMAPILSQLGVKAGLDPFVVAFVIIMALSVGPATPPVGIAIFTASVIAEEKIESIAKEIIPFVLSIIIAIILVIKFPSLIKWLPSLFGHAV
jgi:tripartite ATP-independent transporter DctM subunit